MSIKVYDPNYKFYRIDIERGTLGGEPVVFAYAYAQSIRQSPSSFFDFAPTLDEAIKLVKYKVDTYGVAIEYYKSRRNINAVRY